MLTECSQGFLRFFQPWRAESHSGLDGGSMTSNAGALLLRETDCRIGLSPRVIVTSLGREAFKHRSFTRNLPREQRDGDLPPCIEPQSMFMTLVGKRPQK